MIYGIGDSHISYLINKSEIIAVNKWTEDSRVRIINVGPFLAFNLFNKTDVIFNLVKKTVDNSDLFLSFGEIDCRAHVKKQSDIQKKEPRAIVEEIVDKYISFIREVKKIKNNNIIAIGIAPPLKEKPFEEYYASRPDDIDTPRGTKAERYEYKKIFDTLMHEKSESLYKYISFFRESGKDDFIDDIHLNPSRVNKIIFNKYEKLKNA